VALRPELDFWQKSLPISQPGPKLCRFVSQDIWISNSNDLTYIWIGRYRNGFLFQEVDPEPGTNPKIVSYNAIAVKIYNCASSLVRFEIKIFSSNLKNALA
jgi:hypothetical protein